MKPWTLSAAVPLALACSQGAAAVDDGTLVRFVDQTTGFSTVNVIDLDGEVVRFDWANNTLIWTATGERFPNWPVYEGYLMGPEGRYTVGFGEWQGASWAWFISAQDGLICDLRPSAQGLLVLPTTVPVPVDGILAEPPTDPEDASSGGPSPSQDAGGAASEASPGPRQDAAGADDPDGGAR